MSSPPNSRCAPNPFRTERASALIAILFFAAVVALFAAHILERSLQEGKLATRSYYLSVAQNLAEAGLEDALFAANNTYFTSTHGWSTSTDGTSAQIKTTTGLTLAQGTGEIYIRVISANTATPTVIALGVVRLTGQAAIVKQLRMAIVKRNIWANTMVAKGAITFSGNATVDSYDSSVGVYNSSTNRTDQAIIASTSTALDPIDVSSNATIYGFAATAGADPVVSAAGRIYGATSPANPLVDPTRVRKDFSANLPDATAPTGSAISLGAISNTTTLPRVGDTATNGRYLYTADSLNVAGTKIISINGPVDLIVTGAVSLSGNASLSISGIVANNASLGLYVAGNISLGGNGLVTGTNKPASATIYGTATSASAQTITIAGNGEFVGAIYAPNATLALTGNGASSGAAIAKSITLGGNGKFHYDTQLAATGTVTSSGDRYFRPDTWIEMTQSAGSGDNLARDNHQPFDTVL